MNWIKKGLIYCPSGEKDWAQHSFMTPVPMQINEETIRLFGGMRDHQGISRIGWIDVERGNPSKIQAICETPVLELGDPGMFDDNGMILGAIIKVSENDLRLYYIGFQLVEKVKFLAFTGLAISHDNGLSFERLKKTPLIDRMPHARYCNALHSIEKKDDGYRAWISCGNGWENINGTHYPQYDCWLMESEDGIDWGKTPPQKFLECDSNEYRIGRPTVNRKADGTYELRVTSDTRSKEYGCFRLSSRSGTRFTSKRIRELPRGQLGAWDDKMTCYPIRLDTSHGESYLFYNGNEMGRTGVGFASLKE